ncbi:bile acid:sodium symporter family protein [Pseudomaricurvus alkylphenolicus]|uniref:bile acid:sodium symporter family protein n=1 Tax=Pseudomaricurvus alkylphenolicus TaxID=1306991 RepID=UPI00141E0734|nr:bile acid:sodium symporter [Pseudomaricurvus alkylphenolicus]NIB42481.1 bile acid:sodium symporter family protein [Pseudomaricurvus alkylphenolicus]
MSVELLTQAFLPISLVLMMVGMGAGLQPSDFSHLLRQRRALLAGLIGQLILLPLAAVSTALAFDAAAWFAVGLVIIAASPGGIASNVVSFAVGGNMALSIGLTAISSMACVFTIPLWVSLALGWFAAEEGSISLPFWRTLLSLISLTLVPVAAGMLLGLCKPKLAERVERVSRALSLPFLCLVMVLVVVSQFEFLLRHLGQTAVPLLLFLGLMATVAMLLSRAFHLGSRDCKTILVEVGLQNTTLALMVAMTLLNEPRFSVIPGCYGVLMFLVLVPVFVLQRRSDARYTILNSSTGEN